MMNDDSFPNESRKIDRILVAGALYQLGDSVRICPHRETDILDIALKGKIATIAAIEQDLENRIYLAVTIDDDPGQDLGIEGQPGHRFFYRPEDVELLQPEFPESCV
jgi:hypothetical protein